MIRRHADVLVFLIVALGTAWLVASPIWAGAIGMASPFFGVIAIAMMFTPALAVLAVWWTTHRDVGARQWARRTGLTSGGSKGRTFGLVAAAWLGTPVVVGLAIALSAALGLLTLDLDGLSLFRAQLEAAGAGRVPAGTLAVVQIAAAVFLAPLVNAIPALGEEWGWRGWLLPRLMPLGTGKALLVSGLIWGVWHAPLTLLGYNYPALGAGAMPMFVGFCVVYGVVIGWLRLASHSVWPAVFAHGSLNAVGSILFLLGDAENPPNVALAGVTGLVGWVLLTAIGVVLLRVWPVRDREPVGVG